MSGRRTPADRASAAPAAPGCSTAAHRDTLLTEPERANGMMLICISRAARGQRLTLDL